MNSFIELNINAPYPGPIQAQEGAYADFLRPGSNRLVIALADLQQEEIRTLKKGLFKAGLLAGNGAILFLWQFNNKSGPLFSLESPFDARLIPDRQLYDIAGRRTRLEIDLHVVDPHTRILKAMRTVTMPPELTLKFLSAVQDQVASADRGIDQLSRWMTEEPSSLSAKTRMFELGK